MNQKNVMFLVIDACNADYLGSKDYKPSCSPFLDSLSERSHTFSNVFSSGPYTEAAMMELMAVLKLKRCVTPSVTFLSVLLSTYASCLSSSVWQLVQTTIHLN